MTQLTFRTMIADDIDNIMKLETSLHPYPWTKGIFNDCINAGYLCYLSEIEDEIIAYSALSYGAGESHILNISVAKSHQGKGFGKQLMQFMMQQAQIKKAEMVLLEVRGSNHNAIALYESQGFNEIGIRKGYYPAPNGKEDAIMFAIQLM